jgi:hypothetical protein
MDVGSIVSAFLASRVAEMQLAAAAKLAKMQADNPGAVVKLVAAADQNMRALTAGLGGHIDISA